jgi:hypothetical protein
MLIESQTAPSRFREPNKWNASRCFSSVLSKIFSHSEMPKYSRTLMKGLLLALSGLFLIPVNLLAWTNGELLIWMDADRAYRRGAHCNVSCKADRRSSADIGIREAG